MSVLGSQLIPTQMHRLATRLGVRDGEAYTIVCGLVVALVLAVVGLPGVFRGFDPAGLDQAAAASPSAPSTSVPDSPATTTESATTPSLPSLAPGPLPSLPASPSAPAPAPTTIAPPATGGDDRPLGEQSLLAEVPDPGAPDDIAVGPDGTVYVVSDDDLVGGGPSALWAFSSTGDLLQTWTAPDQPSTRTRGLTGVAVDPDGTVWVTDAATARLLRLDRAEGALVPVAEVDDIAACGLLNLDSPCEPGLLSSAPLLTDVASAPDGTIVVADRGQGTIWRLDGSDLEVLTTITDRLPGDGPIAVSFASNSELLVAVGASGARRSLRRRVVDDDVAALGPQVLGDGRADASGRARHNYSSGALLHGHCRAARRQDSAARQGPQGGRGGHHEGEEESRHCRIVQDCAYCNGLMQ